MEPVCSPLVVIGALLALLASLGIGVVILVKLGVVARYTLKEEEPDQGDYDLDQSHEADQE
jgi:hypothetical protein